MKYRIADDEKKGRIVIATADIEMGEVVCVGMATRFVEQRDRFSVQIDDDVHVSINSPAVVFSHSCEWNLALRDNVFSAFDFVATRPIARGEELSWHYGMSEATSISVPKCHCGSPGCLGRSFGFEEAPESLRVQLLEDGVAAYLHRSWASKRRRAVSSSSLPSSRPS